jgi:hypothetical protein
MLWDEEHPKYMASLVNVARFILDKKVDPYKFESKSMINI